MKLNLFINVKMSTKVCIITFIGSFNTRTECLSKSASLFSVQYFKFYEQLKFHAKLR